MCRVGDEDVAYAMGAWAVESSAKRRPKSGWVGSVTSTSVGRLAWVLTGLLSVCSFDNISHPHSSQSSNFCVNQTLIVLVESRTYGRPCLLPTDKGTPQGGVTTLPTKLQLL